MTRQFKVLDSQYYPRPNRPMLEFQTKAFFPGDVITEEEFQDLSYHDAKRTLIVIDDLLRSEILEELREATV